MGILSSFFCIGAFFAGRGWLWWLVFSGIVLLAVLLLALLFLVPWGLCNYRRYPEAEEKKRYAFFIPARNEENVIARTIASIRAMNYPQDKVTIFVLANNCSDDDRTAEIARAMGEEVFELKDKSVKNVGMVLERFFAYIKQRYDGYNAFDGYVRLDADNLVHPDYLSKLNDAFVAHPYVVTTYRANQNFEDGVRASLSCLLMTQSMMAFRLFSGWRVNPIITGPGLLIGAEVLNKTNGWNCKTISEDMEFSAVLIKHKIRAHFCYEAIFYDEQPRSLKIAMRQNIRWAKGVSQIFFKYWFCMIARVFSKIGLSALFMVIGLCPIGLLTVVFTSAFAIYGFVLALQTSSFWTAFMFCILPIIVNLVMGWFMAAITFVIERKRISLPFWKKLLYTLTFPLAYAIRNIADFVRIFLPTKWKPIPHGQAKILQVPALASTNTNGMENVGFGMESVGSGIESTGNGIENDGNGIENDGDGMESIGNGMESTGNGIENDGDGMESDVSGMEDTGNGMENN